MADGKTGWLKLLALAGLVVANAAWAGHQIYQPLSDSVRTSLSASVSDAPVSGAPVLQDPAVQRWIGEMSRRLAAHMPDARQRQEFLSTEYYESVRAGLDPDLVLGVIEVESGFHKYAISSADARGYMQVMPFWVGLIGRPGQDLFHLRTNLRYGCNILRFYIDQENGDLYRALGRYNGSLGQPDYPVMVVSAWKHHWDYPSAGMAQSGSRMVAGR